MGGLPNTGHLSQFCVATLLAAGLLTASWAQEPAAAAATGESSPGEAAQAAPSPSPEPEVDYSLSKVLDNLRADTAAAKQRLAAREARYQSRLDASRQRLEEARNLLAKREAEGRRLETAFDSNGRELDEKAQLLKDKIGALKELFGVFQQNASDLIGAFSGSPTSIQYPDRDIWLEAFAERMKDASEVSSTEDIRALWFEVMREIQASGQIVSLKAPVQASDGTVAVRDIVRIGNFNLISQDPEPGYLVWRAGRQQAATLPRQPEGPYRAQIDQYLNAPVGASARDISLRALSVDPTQGVLLELLIEKPTLRERIDQGGLVGYVILALGGLSLVLALLKLADITLLSGRVALQSRRNDKPLASNPLGRLLLSYQQHREADSETLAMHLHDRLNKEDSRINRFTIFLAIIAAVAPLLGLLGTVVGMINTFQAITLYGTGDPQTMAGGISQALITTVLGLVVAVPAVLLHAVVSARGKALVTLLKQQMALLLGDRLEEEGRAPSAGKPAPTSADSSPQPA